MSFDSNIDLQSLLSTALLRIGIAIAILLAGRWLAGLVSRSVRTAMKRTRASPSLMEILARAAFYVILTLSIFFALVFLGVPADVLLGALAIVIIVAAFALRESLSDIAATINFIIFQPFKTGDVIETNGITGVVRELLLFNTVLITGDNRQVTIPNSKILNSNLFNLSSLDEVRLDLSVRLSYADPALGVQETLLGIAKADSRVLETPPPLVHIMQLGESQVEYILRVYSRPANTFELRPALNEQIKARLEQGQLTLPIPQLQVHDSQSLPLNRSDPQQDDRHDREE